MINRYFGGWLHAALLLLRKQPSKLGTIVGIEVLDGPPELAAMEVTTSRGAVLRVSVDVVKDVPLEEVL